MTCACCAEHSHYAAAQKRGRRFKIPDHKQLGKISIRPFFTSINPIMANIQEILQTISQKKQELENEFSLENAVSDSRYVSNLDPEVCELYRGVAKLMARYRSGVLPKAFKIIPTLTNWEQILQITMPENWTAASMCEATKLFSSNLKDDMAQRFYNIILLPRLRDEIAEYKKLNFHMYNALKRSLYKPSAFYKGIILPLCDDSADTSLREAVIISSVLKKAHVPLLHSAAAMLKIAEMPYSATRCVFLMDLISKNYALPYRVLDGIVSHFTRYTSVPVELNVQWHQTLLKFCQLYCKDIAEDQKEAIITLVRHQNHPLISPEIRKIVRQTPNASEMEVVEE